MQQISLQLFVLQVLCPTFNPCYLQLLHHCSPFIGSQYFDFSFPSSWEMLLAADAAAWSASVAFTVVVTTSAA